MFFWEWERLESYVEDNLFSISDPGKLLSPVRSVRVWRDEKLCLVMETKSGEHPSHREQEHPPGTLRKNEEAVEFSSPGGDTARAFGVDIRNTRSHTNHQHGTHETVQTCSVHYFESATSQSGNVAYVFDWVANIDQRYYIWPDGIRDSVQEVSTRTFGYGADPVILTATSTTDGGSRNCVELNVGGIRVILGSTELEAEIMTIKPGYIIYLGHIDEETRKRIRDSLSFALGFPIVYFGYAEYNERQKLTYLKAFSAYSMDGRAFNVPVMAPAPICSPAGSNMLDRDKLSEVANSFFDNYHSYSLSSLNWVYWHAVTAPAHMAAAYFGAAIENIQKKYLESAGTRFNNLIIPKQEYRLLRKAVFEAIKNCDLTVADKKTFEEKINSGNVVSLKVRSHRFFEHLGLDMGSAEVAAWQRRNDAAHGNELEDGDYISLIRDTKLLKLILHRIVLTITGASEEYIDYYSLYFPIRALNCGVSE
ncbi:hypothetical protein Pav013_3552 [Pseudomonas syringae pv. avellanae str. ISPaVe013]|uniref:hypothetical protein n=1 Tax=Pseudomonas syringae TaxID=317 RepID=UPI00028E0018|nr:hypothetical protein [Pseudomonas syringae]EKG37166.1 hypothetical protein Pav013_3552 [Pseudomonas syringae pv. avellanae str. ISPaVe013]